MTLELGEVIARIGGDGGGGGPVPHRYVYDLDDMPILPGGQSGFLVPDVPEGATLVATLEWAGPETGGFAVVMGHGIGVGVGVAFNMGMGFPPVTVVSPANGPDRGIVGFEALAEGYTATSLTVIVIPHIEDTPAA